MLDTQVKRGAKLSTNHYLVVNQIRCWTQTFNEDVLGTYGRGPCLGDLELTPPAELILHSKGEIETKWVMFCASIAEVALQNWGL